MSSCVGLRLERTHTGPRVARDRPSGKLRARPLPELVLSLRERELARFAIVARRTTIGRDPGCDVVIDNVGISRLHATIEVVGDSFVLRDCESENGITLNGETCNEGRLVHGDMVGLNKFLLRFSNHGMEIPANLQTHSDKSQANLPKEVERTMHVDADVAQALADRAKEQIARRRAQIAAGGDESLPPMPRSEPAVQPRDSMRWEEPEGAGRPLVMIVGAAIALGALIAGLWSFVF